jgi:hypothetical protein
VLVIPRPCKRAPQEKHSLTVLPYAEGKLNVVLADHHGHGAALGFQQIQGGQQITILGLRAFGERNSWLTGVVAAVDCILKRPNLLACLNLLETMGFQRR